MIGRTFPNYRIVSELGAGAMGVVYKAVDLRLDRHVALKILPPEKSGDAERRSRFLQEAKAASALNDPHIVTIYDIFTDDGTDVLVMELVQGRTLREVIADGAMPVTAALGIASQIAEGVGSAHAVGIVHRDLKPGNIMLTDRGRVKVLDFGLAKLFGDALAQQQTVMAPTIAGTLLGTVDYMSPEQARGEAVDGRSDVFSLGAMLYELLTGTRPFTAPHVAGVLHEILYGTLLPPRARRPDVPAAVDTIVLRALERDITRRYQSMEAFAGDLRQAQRRLEAPPPAASVVVPPPLPPQAAAVPPAMPPSAMPLPPPLHVAAVDAFPRRRRKSRAGETNRRGPRWRIIWAIVLVFMVFGSAREWMRDSIDGSGQPTTSPSAEREDDDPRPATATDDVPGIGSLGGFIEERVISALESAVRNAPDSADARVELAKMYWRRAQSTKDPEYMQRASDAFNAALRIEPDNSEALQGLREIAASPRETASP